jgi:hypothetical protein
MIDFDIVNNQNGRFKYVYDNGPSFRRWEKFEIVCDDKFQDILGANGTTQFNRLKELWNYKGTFGMGAPEDSYSVHWAKDPLEKSFIVFPREVGDKIELSVAISLEEA